MALRVLEKTKDIGEPQGKSGARKGAQIFSLGGGDHFFHHKCHGAFLRVGIVAGGIVDCERLAILPVQVRTTRAQGAPFMRHLPEPCEGLTATA